MAKRKKPEIEKSVAEMLKRQEAEAAESFAAYRAEPLSPHALPLPEHVIGMSEEMAAEIQKASAPSHRSPIKNERLKEARAAAREIEKATK